jgi:hypothetical protein
VSAEERKDIEIGQWNEQGEVVRNESVRVYQQGKAGEIRVEFAKKISLCCLVYVYNDYHSISTVNNSK